MFSNRVYDKLKYFALVVLPLLGSLYFGLDQIWGLPKAIEVVGTITVFDTFLGMLLRKSNQTYQDSGAKYDGAVNRIIDEGATMYSIDVDGDPHEVLEKKDELVLKVNKEGDGQSEDFVATDPVPRKRGEGGRFTK